MTITVSLTASLTPLLVVTVPASAAVTAEASLVPVVTTNRGASAAVSLSAAMTALVGATTGGGSATVSLSAAMTATADTTGVQRGATSAVTLTAALSGALGGSFKGIYQDVSSLTIGATYTVTARVRSNGHLAVLRAYDGFGTLNPVSASILGNGEWQTLTVTKVAPAGASIRVAIEVNNGGVVDVDGIQVELGAVASDFHLNTGDAGGTYHYQITRDLDGSGANDWYAGDAVFNTGQTGNGFIDLHSQHGVTARLLTHIFNYDAGAAVSPYEAGTYSPNYATAIGWDLWRTDTTLAANDAIYFGRENLGAASKWNNLYLTLDPAVWTGPVAVWEYWTGTAWTNLSPVATGSFTTGGAVSATFSVPVDWAAKTINGVNGWWVRYRITAITSITTYPRQVQRRVYWAKRTYGPTIVGNVRNSNTFNDWSEHWAIGNLTGLYDYGTDTYGAALGKYSATTAWVGIDPANGMRIMYGSTQKARYSDTILLGQELAGQFNTLIGAGYLRIRQNTTSVIDIDPTGVKIASPTDANDYVYISANEMRFYGAGVPRIRIGGSSGAILMGPNTLDWSTIRLLITGSAAGGFGEANETLQPGSVLFGRNASGYGNMLWDSSDNRLKFRGGTTVQSYIDTDGSIVAAAGNVKLNGDGLRFTIAAQESDLSTTRKVLWGSTTAARGWIHGYTESGGFAGHIVVDVRGHSGVYGGRFSVLVDGSSSGQFRIWGMDDDNSAIGMYFNGGFAIGGSKRQIAAGWIDMTGSLRTTSNVLTVGGIINAYDGSGLTRVYMTVSSDAGEIGSLRDGVAWKQLKLGTQGDAAVSVGNATGGVALAGPIGVNGASVVAAHGIRSRVLADTSGAFGLVVVSSDQSTNRLLVRGDSFFGISAAAWTNISDQRIKTDVVPLDEELDVVAALMGTAFVAFRYTDRPDPGRHFGVIAQEAIHPWPMLTHQFDESGLMGFNYTELIPPLGIMAQRHERQLREMRDEIAELRAMITDLLAER
jgi:hypothetical protein